MTTWILGLIALLVAGVLVVAIRALRWLRGSAAALQTLVRSVGASARVTSTTQAARDQVHLVLMDRDEKAVEYVLRVDPQQRAQTVTHGPYRYECASGSVNEGYFVYRRG